VTKLNRKKMARKLWLLSLLFSSLSVANAQVVDVPLNHPSYRFIDRMEAKGLVRQVRNGTKPISRLKMAQILLEIEENASSSSLTRIEREQLQWLKSQFKCELERLGEGIPLASVSSPRWWALFPRKEKEGLICLDPVLAFSSQSKGSRRVYHRTTGVKVYGYLSDAVGFYLYARDSSEWAKGNIRWKPANPQEGFWDVPFPQKGIGHTGSYGKRIDHDEVDAAFSLRLPWFRLSIAKGSNTWGPGYRGQLALSDWAPSYGQIKLSAQYGNWLDFTYIHAFLHSNIVDSLRSYRTDQGYERILHKRKYLAGNRLEITPIPGIDVGVSETIIYGERDPEILYLIPVMFLWSAQHYLGDPDNLQMSADIDLNLIRHFKLYGCIFVDEIYVSKIFTKKQHNWVGLQGGLFWVDLLENLDFRAEYTRVNPCVYSHKFPINNFESYGYLLGHQIGQNADQLYLEANYRYIRPLLLTLSWQQDRKGRVPNAYEQYHSPSQRFLSGRVKRQQSWALRVSYEPLRALFLKIGCRFIANPKGEQTELSFGLEYNL